MLSSLTIQGKRQPLNSIALDAYEKRSGFELPASYRHFCGVFGPGDLGGETQIAVPAFATKIPDTYDLESLNRVWHEYRGWRQYAKDPEQFGRGIIFGGDGSGGVFLWEPAEPTERQCLECAIYAVRRNWSHERLCNTFGEFAASCVGKTAGYSEVGFRSILNVLTKR